MPYIDTKERGLVYETLNDTHKPLYHFLKKYQQALDGSRLYDDLIDVYQSQIIISKDVDK